METPIKKWMTWEYTHLGNLHKTIHTVIFNQEWDIIGCNPLCIYVYRHIPNQWIYLRNMMGIIGYRIYWDIMGYIYNAKMKQGCSNILLVNYGFFWGELVIYLFIVTAVPPNVSGALGATLVSLRCRYYVIDMP